MSRLACLDCAADWSNIIKEIRGREAYAYPVGFHELFKKLLPRGEKSIVTNVKILEKGEQKVTDYSHIPFADLTNDLLLMVHWTGSIRFDPLNLKNTLYKIKYSNDIRRFKSEFESCHYIHTHGRIEEIKEVNAIARKRIVDTYMLFKTGLWRYLYSFGCPDQFTYTNNVSLPIIYDNTCADASLGFMTGCIKDKSCKRVGEELKQLSKYNYLRLLEDVILYECDLDVVCMILSKSSLEGIKIARKKVKVYLNSFPDSVCNMYIVIKPKCSDPKYKPLVVDSVPENKLTKYVSAHALLYAILFASINKGVDNPISEKELVKKKYERIVHSPANTLGIGVLPFEEVVELCEPLLDSYENNLYIKDTRIAIKDLESEGSFSRRLAKNNLLRKYGVKKFLCKSIGIKEIFRSIRNGCSLIF